MSQVCDHVTGVTCMWRAHHISGDCASPVVLYLFKINLVLYKFNYRRSKSCVLFNWLGEVMWHDHANKPTFSSPFLHPLSPSTATKCDAANDRPHGGDQGTWKGAHGGHTRYAHYFLFSFYSTDFDSTPSNTQLLNTSKTRHPAVMDVFWQLLGQVQCPGTARLLDL